jgi:hypothetical protein
MTTAFQNATGLPVILVNAYEIIALKSAGTTHTSAAIRQLTCRSMRASPDASPDVSSLDGPSATAGSLKIDLRIVTAGTVAGSYPLRAC